MFFDGFELATTQVPGGVVRYRVGGAGPALLLLHGNPQTHFMWHRIAPALAKRFTVICPDLRGYGGSEKPPATPDHAPYAKTAMAQDVADLMTQLGHETFAVGAHDRGARVAHRLAIDFRSGSPSWRCSTSSPRSNISSARTCPSPSAIITGSGSPSRTPSPRT